MLAHEIGHVEKRHIARQNEGQGLSTLVTLAGLAAAIAAGKPEALVAAQGMNVSLQLKHSREFESEADREGIAIMAKTGYDPDGMRRFFQRILAQNPGAGAGIPAYLFTHPAVAERIAATKIEMDRIGAPRNVKHDDTKLVAIQERLAQLLSPDPSGGSGLHARASFDASKTDPLLAKAREARIDGNDGLADELLAQAQQAEPGDPRVALERADLDEQRGDLESARGQLERALALDPNVPLVQYQLGVLNARLGNKSRAAFYLEQAVANFRPKTAARRRAEFELARLEFKLLDESGLADGDGRTGARRVQPRRPGHLVGRDLASASTREPRVPGALARSQGRGRVQRARADEPGRPRRPRPCAPPTPRSAPGTSRCGSRTRWSRKLEFEIQAGA